MTDRDDVEIVLGGLAPVPFTFVLGRLLDNEGPLTVLDWDRHKLRWRELKAADDGERLEFVRRDLVSGEIRRVCLLISLSYTVDVEAVETKFPDVPIIHLKLPTGGPDTHWSVEKQSEIARQYNELMFELTSMGIQNVDFFLAGPSSLVFRLGIQYDRNWPAITVYQYERNQVAKFPWGIQVANMNCFFVADSEVHAG